MSHVQHYADCVAKVTASLNWEHVDFLIASLVGLRQGNGRLFVLGVGGSAANASHAVNDFRRLCRIEAYAPTDNIASLTAVTNDDGWMHTFTDYLRASNLTGKDAILVLSVGGGDAEKNISVNIVDACLYAKLAGASIYGIIGKPEGYTATVGDCVIVVPPVDMALLTPLAESFQSVILHCVVSHPKLAIRQAKWEGMS